MRKHLLLLAILLCSLMSFSQGHKNVLRDSTVFMNGVQIPNNAQDGYVLTSDSIGNAVWKIAVGGAGFSTDSCYLIVQTDSLYACSPLSIGVTNGGNKVEAIAIDTNGNVGIGTANQYEKFSVHGNSKIDRYSGSVKYSVSNTDDYGPISILAVDTSFGNGTFFEMGVSSFQYFVRDSTYDGTPPLFSLNSQYAIIQNCNFGIGAATPTAKLHVNGDGISPTAKFDVNGVEAMRIDTNGNVGIGTETPSAGLHIQGKSIEWFTSDTIQRASFLYSHDTTISISSILADESGSQLLTRSESGAEAIIRLFRPTGHIQTQYLSDSTYFGIGTETPTAKLHVTAQSPITATIIEQQDSGGTVTERNTLYGGEVTRYHLKVHLDSTQIQNANSSPIDIGLPPSGAGYYYRVTAFDAKLTFNSAVFTSTLLQITYASKGGGSQNWNIQGLLDAGSTTFKQGTAIVDVTIEENDTVSITADSDSATGDSSIDCYITVEKVKM